MATEETTSSGTSETQTPDMPETGTPATQSATPEKPSLSLEEAMKRIAELEHKHTNASEELTRHRKKLSSYEKAEKEAEAAKKAAEEAQLSEIERTKKQFADLQAQHENYVRQTQERLTRHVVEKQASQLGIIDPDAATRLLDWNELEFDDDGQPINADKLLETLIKHKPWLKPAPPKEEAPKEQEQQPAQPAPPRIPAMQPGRSNISAPNKLPPGTIPTLADVYKRP